MLVGSALFPPPGGAAPPRPLRPTLRLDFIVMQMRPWPLHTIWMRLLMAFTATCKDVYSCGARAQPRRSSQRVRATRAYLVSGWQETRISYGYECEIRPSCRAGRTYGFVAPDSWSLRVPASRDRTTVGHGVPHACERCSGGAGTLSALCVSSRRAFLRSASSALEGGVVMLPPHGRQQADQHAVRGAVLPILAFADARPSTAPH